MDYQYKVILNGHNVYKEFEIPLDMEKFRIGTEKGCEFRLNSEEFFDTIELFFYKRTQWNVDCGQGVYFSKGDFRKLYSVELLHGEVLEVCYEESGVKAFELRFQIDFEAEIPQYNDYIQLTNVEHLSVGDQDENDIVIQSPFSRGSKFVIFKENDNFYLEEIFSQYGVQLNGKKVEGTSLLSNYDFISLGDSFFFFKDNCLFFDEKREKVKKYEVKKTNLITNSSYPMFVRNTRVKAHIDDEEISILDPGAIPTKPEVNIVITLMPTLVMFALVVVLRGIMSTTGGTYVLFTICSMGMGVITSILSLIEQRKKYKRECIKRTETYLEYVERKKEEIINARQLELDCLKETYYSTEQDLVHIESFDSKLFDRIPVDDDFLDVYLGVGECTAVKRIKYKAQEKLESADELSMLPNQLAEQFKLISNAPIFIKLLNANAVGVIGNKESQYSIFKNIIIDLISRQYFGDLSIYTILGEDTKRYDWLRYIPHMNGNGYFRNIVCDNESKNNIFEFLYKEFCNRSDKNITEGYNVVFVLEEQGIKSHPISKFIEKASEINTVFIFFEDKEEYLPLYCSQIIELVDKDKAILFESENRTNQKEFRFMEIPDQRITNAVKLMAPIYCEEISLESSLKKSITLFELLGIYSVEDIDLSTRWSMSKICDSMRVPLGINAKDDLVYLDLHEKYHGPHGLVAGTTGSGKSEILQTYILGAATLFHPYEIGFVIIDFKGGGMVNQFKNLPHLIGAITNIDGKAIDRSLKSIKAELLKRQSLFAEMEVNHIDKYIKAYKEGKARIALPHLVIIVDEFAELKAEQPEFMKELISAARIGRSLGVHLILATQKPAGQVNEQIWSNSKFKLCLKVQTKEDSNEVLKSPLAAEIREPGRAYLQVGNNEIFELLQSGYSGAPEKSDDTQMKNIEINELNFKGIRRNIFKQKAQKSASSKTQLEAIVDYVGQYCESKAIKRLPEICLPALGEVIQYKSYKNEKQRNMEMKCAIGIYDDPDNQFQGLAEVSLALENTIIIGSAQCGKTNLVEVMIRSVAENYSPKEVNMYIIDFGSMVLKNFDKLSHVGGVVCPSEDERLKNLFKFLREQVEKRREKMLSVGVSSFYAYREAGYDDLPQIIVFIENFTALKELYLQDNDVLIGLCREGISVGITFIVTNTQTNGFGYKYLSNFSNRIALFCNESGEYSSLFGSCRMRPDEVIGRCLLEIDKSIYECQTFLAFDGEKELDRVKELQNCINCINSMYPDIHATSIPEIPKILTEKYLYDNYNVNNKPEKLSVGLDYESVSSVDTEIFRNNLLAVVGREESGKTNFIKYVIKAICKNACKTDVFIFDNYKRKLQNIEFDKAHIIYKVGVEEYKDSILELEALLTTKYKKLINGETTEYNWNIMVFNNEDIVSVVSDDKETIAALKNIVGKYKMLNTIVVIGNVANAQISYGSLELLKMIKESKNIMYFDDISNAKIVDVPSNFVRTHRNRIELGDAFYILGNECYKVKTPYVE